MTALAPPPAERRWRNPTWGPRPTSADEVFDRPGSMWTLAVLRIAMGPAVLGHLAPFLADSLRGKTYRDKFFEPWWDVLPVVPGSVQTAIIWTGAVAAVALALGWRTRLAGPIAWCCVAANLFLSQSHFRHNRAFLLVLLGAVVLSESHRVLSLDARRARRRGRPFSPTATLWPLWTVRALAASVYGASGFSKLIDPDWVGGLVLWDRAVRFQHTVHDTFLPGPVADVVVDLVTARWFHAITSPIAVAMELFICVGLWFDRTRLAAIWTALFFHASIEVAASVEVFSLAAAVALVLWVTPSTRDRTVTASPDEARRIRRLDWLARFDVREEPGAPLTVVDRDGSVRRGESAHALVWTRLPLTFPVAAPAAALGRRRGRRSGADR